MREPYLRGVGRQGETRVACTRAHNLSVLAQERGGETAQSCSPKLVECPRI